MIWTKYKKIIWIALAALFLVALFLLKNGIFFKNNPNKNPNGTIGLTYGANGETMGDLVNKSTTGDGIPDWEKRLYGLDPTKKENVPGVPDSVTIAKLQAEQEAQNGLPSSSGQDNSNLTQTDKFSKICSRPSPPPRKTANHSTKQLWTN